MRASLIFYAFWVPTLSIGLGIYPSSALSATVRSGGQVSEIVEVRNVNVRNNTISAEVVNKTANVIREVQLLVRHIWHWKDEFRPGKASPGEAVFYDLKRELEPGKSMTFNDSPPSLPPREKEGHFEVVVSDASFTEVIPQ